MPEGGRVLLVALSARSLAAAARRAGWTPLAADLFCDEDTRALAHRCVKVGTSPSPPLQGDGGPRSERAEGQHRSARSARLPTGKVPKDGAAPPPALRTAVTPQTGRGGLLDDWRTMDADLVLAALEDLAVDVPVEGIVYGTGLEDNPELIRALGRRWLLWGNDAATVARLKEPAAFARMCRTAGVLHPEIALGLRADVSPSRAAGEGDQAKRGGESKFPDEWPAAAPSTPPRGEGSAGGRWLVKKAGGSGGGHIRPAHSLTEPAPTHYLQRRVNGRPVSALFLADGARARIVGFSEQWTAPTPEMPYRYAGAVQPADLDPAVAATLTRAVERLVAASGVIGLCSADFLLDGERAWCLEINPRPGATLDIFDGDAVPLLALHVRACTGDLPAAVPPRRDARAALIVYAEREIAAVPEIDWPKWAADRQPAGSRVAAGEPLCTVLADAPTREEALRRVRSRADAMMLAAMGRAA